MGAALAIPKTSTFDDYTDLAQRESEDLDPSYSIPEPDFGKFNFPDSMTLPRQKTGRKPFDINEVAQFIGDYVRNDCFADPEDLITCLADQTRTGMNDKRVKELAPWLSKAVGYAKSGKEVNLIKDIFEKPEFRVVGKPDFLIPLKNKSLLDSRGEYYSSPNLLGRI